MDVDLTPVSKFFWDIEFYTLNWRQHRDFIIRRILQNGDFLSFCWLRSTAGDPALHDWVLKNQGRGLSPRQIRYWALILDIEPNIADEWVKSSKATIWEQRIKR